MSRMSVLFALLCIVGLGIPPGAFATTIPVSTAVQTDYALVPHGTYTMGGDEWSCGTSVHTVTLTRDFFLAQYEVTNQQYLDLLQWAYDHGFVTVSGSHVLDLLDPASVLLVDLASPYCEIQFADGSFALRNSGHGINPDHPVKSVSWYGAAAYCNWLSLREGLPRAYDHHTWQPVSGSLYEQSGYRLPSEAEWERAAKYDDDRLYPWGDESPTCSRANYAACGSWTLPVGSLPAEKSIGGVAMYDMAGNAFEWCADWFACDLGTDPVTDPEGPASGDDRFFRGGGTSAGLDEELMCSFRNDAWARSPDYTGGDVGFRCARTAGPVVIITAGVGGPASPHAEFHLQTCRPNPTRGASDVCFVLPVARTVDVTLLDVAGRVVRTVLASGPLAAGEHRVRWNGRDNSGAQVPDGVYLVQVRAGQDVQVRKLIVVR